MNEIIFSGFRVHLYYNTYPHIIQWYCSLIFISLTKQIFYTFVDRYLHYFNFETLVNITTDIIFVCLFYYSHMFSFFKQLGRAQCLSPSVAGGDTDLEERALGICINYRSFQRPRSFLCLLVFFFLLSLVSFLYFVGLKDPYYRRDTFNLIFLFPHINEYSLMYTFFINTELEVISRTFKE